MRSSLALVAASLASYASAYWIPYYDYDVSSNPRGTKPSDGHHPYPGTALHTGGVPYPTGGSHPHGTGVYPPGNGHPTGTGGGSPPTSLPPAPPVTTTIYGPGSTTSTSTIIGTTTVVSTITKFVPCSSPVATAAGTTYYSTSLTKSLSLTTITSTTTGYVVVCPTPTPGHGSLPGTGNDTPAGCPAPTATITTCPVGAGKPAETVYSTIYSTLIINAGSSPSKPTHCPVCTTYTVTLPNGVPITTVYSPEPSATNHPVPLPGGPSHGSENLPPYPTGSHGGSGPNGPTGTGVGPSAGPTASASGSLNKRLYNIPYSLELPPCSLAKGNGGLNSPKAHNRVARRIVPAKFLRLAQLAHTRWGQADVAPARETEQRREDAEPCNIAAGVEPDAEHAESAHGDSGDHGVEPAEPVGDEPRARAPKDASCVEDREQLVREGWGDAIGERVAGDEGQGYEEAPLDEEDACGRQREGGLREYAEIGPDGAADFRGQARADEEDGSEQEDEKDEREKANGPGEAEPREESLQGKREDDAPKRAAGSGETGRLSPGMVEEMRDSADGGRKDEGGAEAA
ncbi:MAG: hypothetical protein Q9167_005403 [Letrouitia subvulpina]